MRRSSNIGGLFLLLMLFIGCKYKGIYEQSFDIPQGEWGKGRIVRLDIPVTDTINGHNIFIEIRNTNDYPYSNLFLFITTYSPNGANKRDTVEIPLADEKGKWLGRGLGGILSNEINFKHNVRFPVSGNYKIEVVQGMRDEVLKGIMDVGIRVERVK
jgi:gliding motility-associated lipoprotein GldH